MSQNHSHRSQNQINTKKSVKSKLNKQNQFLETKPFTNNIHNNIDRQGSKNSSSYLNIHKPPKATDKNVSKDGYSSRLNYIMKNKQNNQISSSNSLERNQFLQCINKEPLRQRLSIQEEIISSKQNNLQSRTSIRSRISSQRSSVSQIRNTCQQSRIMAISRRKDEIEADQKRQIQQHEQQIIRLKQINKLLQNKNVELQKKMIDLQEDLSKASKKNELKWKCSDQTRNKEIQQIRQQSQKRYCELEQKKQKQILQIKLIYQQNILQKVNQIEKLQNFYENQILAEYKLQIGQLKSALINKENSLKEKLIQKQVEIQNFKKEVQNFKVQMEVFKKIKGDCQNDEITKKQLMKNYDQLTLKYAQIQRISNKNQSQKEHLLQQISKLQKQVNQLQKQVNTKNCQLKCVQEKINEISQLKIQKQMNTKFLQTQHVSAKLQFQKKILQLQNKLVQLVNEKQKISFELTKNLQSKSKQNEVHNQNQEILLKKIKTLQDSFTSKQKTAQTQKNQLNEKLLCIKMLQEKLATLQRASLLKIQQISILKHQIVIRQQNMKKSYDQKLQIKQDKVNKLQNQVREQKQQIYQLMKQKSQIPQKIVQSSTSSLQHQFQKLSEQLHKKNLQVEQLTIQNKYKQKRLQNKSYIEEQLLKIQSDIAIKDNKIKTLEQQIKSLELEKYKNNCLLKQSNQEIKKIESKIKQQKKKCEEAEIMLMKRETDVQQKNQLLEDKSNQINKLNNQVQRFNDQIKEITHQNDSMKRKNQQKQQIINQIKSQNSVLKTEVKRLEKRLQQSIKSLQNISNRKRQSLQQTKLFQQSKFKQISQLKTENKHLQESLQKLNEVNQKYRKVQEKYQTLQQQNRELKQKYEKAKQVVKKYHYKHTQQKHIVDNTYRYNQEILNHCQQLLITTRQSIQKKDRRQSKERSIEKRQFAATHKKNAFSEFIHRKQSLGQIPQMQLRQLSKELLGKKENISSNMFSNRIVTSNLPQSILSYQNTPIYQTNDRNQYLQNLSQIKQGTSHKQEIKINYNQQTVFNKLRILK